MSTIHFPPPECRPGRTSHWLAGLAALLVATTAAAAPARTPVPCAKDFPDFIARFAASPKFQRQHTRFPLRYTHVGAGVAPDGGTAVTIKRIHADKYPNLQFPPPVGAGAPPLLRSDRVGGNGEPLVRFERPAPDAYAIDFHFRRTARCWELAELYNRWY